LEKIEVPAKCKVKFKPGRLIREGLNGIPLKNSNQSITDLKTK
jgi:hypothetical protein